MPPSHRHTRTLTHRLVDRLTNYRSRYSYPALVALRAELWWKLEHLGVYRGGDGGLCGRVRRTAYRRRKRLEKGTLIVLGIDGRTR